MNNAHPNFYITPDRLAARIASVLHLARAGDVSIGGIDAETAQALMDDIADATAFSDDAMRAYDLLSNVVTYGRAF